MWSITLTFCGDLDNCRDSLCCFYLAALPSGLLFLFAILVSLPSSTSDSTYFSGLKKYYFNPLITWLKLWCLSFIQNFMLPHLQLNYKYYGILVQTQYLSWYIPLAFVDAQCCSLCLKKLVQPSHNQAFGVLICLPIHHGMNDHCFTNSGLNQFECGNKILIWVAACC